CICGSLTNGLLAFAVETRAARRGVLSQPKHGPVDHYYWTGSGRAGDQNAGGSLGFLGGRDQFPVHHRRFMEAARSAQIADWPEGSVALDRRGYLLRGKRCAAPLADAAGDDHEFLYCRASFI